MDRALLKFPDSLAAILDLGYDAIISVDEEQRILLFNQGAERIFGYSAEEVKGRGLDILVNPCHIQEPHHLLGRRKDGTEFPVEASVCKVEAGGKAIFTVMMRDITDRAVAEEKLRLALREKEALLKEIHHRVKNNLQIVSSLLGLQSRAIPDAAVRKIFDDSQNRISSMALLHECLYHAENFSEVDFPQYVTQLAGNLFQAYGVPSGRIALKTSFDKVSLALDTAVPCGLIINELVSNSLKYAFPEDRQGEVRIDLRGQPGNMAQLVVADNGVGLADNVDWRNSRSLGLRLVRSLSQQLGATIEVKSQEGTEVQLTFPVI